MLFGRGSTGGAVNQVSKMPSLYRLSEVAVTLVSFGPDTVLRRSGGNGTSAKIQDGDSLTFQSDIDERFSAFGWKQACRPAWLSQSTVSRDKRRALEVRRDRGHCIPGKPCTVQLTIAAKF